MARGLQLALIGVIGVAHRTRAHNAGLHLAPQVVAHNLKRVLLDAHLVKMINPVAIRPAVAIDAAMATAAVKIHIVIRAEPFAAFCACDNGFGGHRFNGRKHLIACLC